ncbi:hypothetical protein D7X74_10440 [Corallococcus sp. CA047B]|nr:hypothetical protein D7X74_10440 [Corallococcus sp. CA047B]
MGSRWTAVQPREREKHFVVLRWAGEGNDPLQGLDADVVHWRSGCR